MEELPQLDRDLRRAAARTRLYSYLGLFAVTIAIILGFAARTPNPVDFLPYLLIAATVLLFVILIDLVLQIESIVVKIAFVFLLLCVSVAAILMSFFNTNPMFARFLTGTPPTSGQPVIMSDKETRPVDTPEKPRTVTQRVRDIRSLPPGGFALTSDPACKPSGAATCADVCISLPEGATLTSIVGIMGEGNAPPEPAPLSQCYLDGRDCPIGWSKLANLRQTPSNICVQARNWANDRTRYGGLVVEYGIAVK